MATSPLPYLTEEQYLEIERKSEERHQYHRGEMFAMSGGTGDHASIIAEILLETGIALRGTACRALGSDLRVYIPATGLYTYPDVSVTCGDLQYRPGTKDCLLNPILIVEVLSPSTASYDRGDKFRHYQSIPTLQTYVLVSQERPRVETFTRGQGDAWIYRAFDGLEAVVEIEQPALAIPLASIYRRITFES